MNFKINNTKHNSIVIAAVGILTVIVMGTRPQDIPAAVDPSPTQTTTPRPTQSTTSGNQSYTKTVTYLVPHGTEQITVSLSTNSGTIDSVSIKNSGIDRESAMYQQMFSRQIKSAVVGKKISEVNVSRVAGASLTTRAFMQAIKSM